MPVRGWQGSPEEYTPRPINARVSALPESAPVMQVCKLCGYEELDAQFCPTCLAETMIRKL